MIKKCRAKSWLSLSKGDPKSIDIEVEFRTYDVWNFEYENIYRVHLFDDKKRVSIMINIKLFEKNFEEIVADERNM